ncbi:hypothetical protein MIND_01327200 [Mycena indigotica]|uniref:Uncharacterized protein n=1 Tax=Mycena indigotica TaxID=2126181 RepID=A0A8H6S2J6_9AGAR|nr:uncharacterized protein MIND_01327200 [Mycena indigotica]KAF7290140.1 hypothetical protein MIND_01327200 [Mycena indigotica]
MAPRTPYTGTKRKLILGIDLGTTFSGISYCLLTLNEVPKILPVTRFPPQGRAAGDSKVPSVVWYDRDGQPRALGAQTLDENVRRLAQQEGWEKAVWFKLAMRPETITVSRPGGDIPPLPTDKTPVVVFADFLRYLLQCARAFITQTYPNGDALWISLESETEFVLTHPNGWAGDQQERMRRAAVIAGLIPGTIAGRQRVHFVTEGEASLNFCILNGLASEPLNAGEGVIIVDAGGGTVDISAYRAVSAGRLDSFEEIAPSECLMDGSVFVKRDAEKYLYTLLGNSAFRLDIPLIAECFDEGAKLTFRNPNEFSYIRFGGLRDHDPAVNVESGSLRLPGNVVATFFRPSIDEIFEAVKRQCSNASRQIKNVFMTGGFSANEWLYAELKRRLGQIGLQVSRPDSHVNKAVSDGAVSFYLDHFVSARIAKETYGVEYASHYNPSNKEHKTRESSVYLSIAGDLRIPKQFAAIVRKNTRVEAKTEFRDSFVRWSRTKSDVEEMEVRILRYIGSNEDPHWMDLDPRHYSTMCTVHADTSVLVNTLQAKPGAARGSYYELDFDVVFSLGLTELKAQIAWKEEGIEKRGPAEILYEPASIGDITK